MDAWASWGHDGLFAYDIASGTPLQGPAYSYPFGIIARRYKEGRNQKEGPLRKADSTITEPKLLGDLELSSIPASSSSTMA
jgi:hypothetical protein